MQKKSAEPTWPGAQQRCKEFLLAHGIDLTGKTVLLAVSGGMDSMCMLHLVASMEVDIHVAHMNYGLRGAESDADEELVRKQCDILQIECHVQRVPLRTLNEAGLQTRGRNLRYVWFTELQYILNAHYICTAHHMDDAVETFFINLLRGSGIKGLSGIPAVRDHIVRPMLCFSRAEIKSLVEQERIPYRDDASNFERDYLRNRIRHDVIPLFQRERPTFLKRMHDSQERLRAEHKLLEACLSNMRDQVMTIDTENLIIDLKQVLQLPSPAVVLYSILRELKFSWSQCKHLVDHAQVSGNKYLTPYLELSVDRGKLIVPLSAQAVIAEGRLIEGEGNYVLTKGILKITTADSIEFSNDPNVEFVDASAIHFPLQLRNWEHGDFFYPIGGAGKQKLQDFFTNNKFSASDKKKALILTSQREIVWIIGKRLDHRFRISDTTKLAYRLEWTPNENY